jgi:tRNA threonylcarbamoyladenosine biosynthesis protein TsaE
MTLDLPAAGDTELLGAALASALLLATEPLASAPSLASGAPLASGPLLASGPPFASGAPPASGLPVASAPPPAPALGAVLYLEGELGAGKTTCARSLLRACGVGGLVRSPTYTLVETYATPVLTCVHVDLYRLGAESEAEDLGLRDLAGPGVLLMVEWPERGGAAVPRADLGLSLSYEGQARRAQLRPFTPVGQVWVRNLGDDTRLAPYVSNIT